MHEGAARAFAVHAANEVRGEIVRERNLGTLRAERRLGRDDIVSPAQRIKEMRRTTDESGERMMDQTRFQQIAEQYVNGELDDAAAEELCRAVSESRELCELLRVQAAMHAVLERRGTLGNLTVGRRVQAALRDPTQKKGAITRIMEKLQKKTPHAGTRAPIANLNPVRSAGVPPANCDAGGSPATSAGGPPAPQRRSRSNAFLYFSTADRKSTRLNS